jgi:hypothetical protein
MKGSRLAESGGGDGVCESYIGQNVKGGGVLLGKRAVVKSVSDCKIVTPTNSMGSSVFPSEVHHRPRPGHPLSFISFPCPAPGSSSLFFGTLSTAGSTTKNELLPAFPQAGVSFHYKQTLIHIFLFHNPTISSLLINTFISKSTKRIMFA